jgi:hypothetical protein
MSKLSRETEVLLERGRGGTPLTPAHRERLRGAILAKASGVAVVASAGSASAWTSIGAKIVGAALLVATVGGAGAAIEVWMSGRTPAPGAPPAANRLATDPATASSWKSSPQAPTAISNPAGPHTATSIDAPTLSPSAAFTTTPALTAVPSSSRRETLTPVAAVIASSAVPTREALPASALTNTLARDVRLLRDADLAVKGGDPERALALLDEHAAAFPRSDLEPERSAERVFALCRAGRIGEAKSATSAFLRAHPTGPLAERVKDACRGEPRE